MRKDIFRIAAAVLSFAAVSCTNDIIDSNAEVNQEGNLVPMILTSGPSVRTSLNGSSVNWTADDVVAVYDRNNAANRFTASSVDGSNAVFEGMVAEGTTDFYAVYPYDKAVKATDSEIIVTLPSDQTPAAGTFAEEHNISIASGVKVPGEEEVSGIIFMNICGLVQFTVPERLAAVSEVSFTANDKDIAGNLTVSKSDVKTVVSVSDASRTITMKGSFEAGSTFYFVVAPGQINGFSIKVVAENGAEFSKVSAKSITVAAGAVKNLGVIDFKAEPSAVASHIYPGGILSGTDVTLSLGLPAGMEEYVESLDATMKDSDGNVVRTLQLSGAPASAALTLNQSGNYLYIPQGRYTLDCTFTINGVKDSKSLEVTVPAPQFTVTAAAVTSYTKYQEKKIAEANQCAPNVIYDVKCEVSISRNVLNQIGLTSWNANIPNISGSGSVYEASSQTNFSAYDGGIFCYNETLSVAVGAYKLSASAEFDGVSDSDVADIYVTGLPFKAAPPKTSGDNKWSYDDGVGNIWDGNNEYAKLGNGASGNTSITYSTLHIPADINVSVGARYYVKCDNFLGGSNTFTLNLGSTNVYTTKVKGANSTTINDVQPSVMTSTNNTIVCKNTYSLGTSHSKIYSVTLDYREW